MNIPFIFLLFAFLVMANNGDKSEEETTTEFIAEENSAEACAGTKESTTEPANSSELTEEQLRIYNRQLSTRLKQTLESITEHKIRPNLYGDPVQVKADVEIREILSISEVDMHMKLNLVMDTRWNDPALKYQHVLPAFQSTGVWVGDSVRDKIWTPPVSILNEKDSAEHSSGFVSDAILWFPDGEILWRNSIVTTVSCSMSLQAFPMDEQNCSVLIGSPNYKDEDMKLVISPYLHPFFSNSVKNVELLGIRVTPLHQQSRWENRTVYSYEVLLRRYVGYYVIGTFFPSALIVIISWLTFWMARDAAGERMALGVTCVLTITTLLISSQASSPKVSYIKAIDIYMGVCFTLVFSTLIQSTAVGYLLRKVKIQEAKRRLDGENNGRPSGGFAAVVHRVVAGRLEENERNRISQFILKCDIWCRVIFPLLFCAFNVAYFTYYLTGSRFNTGKGWRKPATYANVSDGRL